MPKKKTAHAYELELRKMIEARTGAKMEIWLTPQVRATAMNQVMLDKIQEELTAANTKLLIVENGSKGQVKQDAHPLLAHYDKLQRTLIMQYQALSLNYNATPSKITENVKKGGSKQDALQEALSKLGDIQ